MARLIPGRVRNEGIDLYESGLVSIIDQQSTVLEARVDEMMLSYAMTDEMISCTCQLFQGKGYCQHLAALEYYLKQDPKGKAALEVLKASQPQEEAINEQHQFGSLFLEQVTLDNEPIQKYELQIEGEFSPYSSDFWWTLKLRRLPEERFYVVRDIKAFITILRKGGNYQIGRRYFEKLSFSHFDEASQEVLNFFDRLIPEKDKQDITYLLPDQGRHLVLPAGFFEEGLYLFNALPHFSLSVGHQIYQSIQVKPLNSSDHLYRFEVLVHEKEIELMISEKNSYVFYQLSYLFDKGIFYVLTRRQKQLAQSLRHLPLEDDLKKHLYFSLDHQDQLATALLDLQELGEVKAPKTFTIHDFEALFTFGLTADKHLSLTMIFDYGELKVSDLVALRQLPFASHYKKEQHIFQISQSFGFTRAMSTVHPQLTSHQVVTFYDSILPAFERLGQVKLSDELAALRKVERADVFIGQTDGLLDISFNFSGIAEEDVSQAMDALMSSQSYFVNQAGTTIIFDEETRAVSQALQDLRADYQKAGHFSLHALAAPQLAELFDEHHHVTFTADFEQMVKDMRHPESFDVPKPTVDAQLRDYQLLGYQWLSMLDHYGFGGILADDMGLGKTLQTISFLKAKLTESSKVLILSPSSLIYNWKEEFEKFAPSLDVAVSYGLKSTRDEIIAENHQIIITSYASFRQDVEQYVGESYDYLILDEAQVIKNAQTKIAKYLRDFQAKNTFALSGTPIENKLLEIWSIFQIILPGLLPSKKEFLKLPAEMVARYVKPFVLRRKKEDVLPELPELIEMTYPNELSQDQKTIYLAQLKHMQDSLSGISGIEFNQTKLEILSGITRLRQICDTPSLFMDYNGSSGKLDSLRELLLQIKENGHRALIFSQFRGMLDIAEQELEKLGLATYKLTGSTPSDQRQAMTRTFNSGSKDAFLISLKAGGVGLNLTGADTVVLIDLWWNPAVEMQAISRAHRLGQEQNVEVYRLITKGTIEEKILELQESKKHLVSTVLEGHDSRANMTLEDIRDILGLTE